MSYTPANERQVGGDHYKTRFQHWDFVPLTGQGYFDGQITKYVTRWRNKEGLADLEKGLHFLDKLIELEEEGKQAWPPRVLNQADFEYMCLEYSKANVLHELESKICWALARGPANENLSLYEIRGLLQQLIKEASAETPHTDSNKHAFQKEDEA